MQPESMDRVFEALSHPVRRKSLDVVKDRPGCSVNDVCDYFDISRIAVMKHLRVLERADLIVSRKNGRKRELYVNVVPIQLIYDRWTTDFSALWASGMTKIKYRLESLAAGEAACKYNPEPATPAHSKPKRKRHA